MISVNNSVIRKIHLLFALFLLAISFSSVSGASFYYDSITVGIGPNYIAYNVKNNEKNIDFSLSATDIISIADYRDSLSLRITGLKPGKVDIKMVDSSGKTLDTLHVTVGRGTTQSMGSSKNQTQPRTQTQTYSGYSITWNCYDATSYDGNAYNDNKCISSTGEERYVSDSQAIALDPSYYPGKSGAYYYNNK